MPGTVVFDGTVGSGTAAFPALLVWIPLATEKQILAGIAAGYQHGDGVGLRETGQVIEVAVLAKSILDVAAARAHGRGRQDHDAVVTDHAHQLFASPRELLAIHTLH